jgi:putative DNA primase/helicase
MAPRLTIDEAAARYWGTYGLGGKALFDGVDRRLVHKDDVLNLLPSHGWDELKKHPGWRVARDTEIGFDPTESDKAIRCNLFGGWPTTPRAGRCERLLELLFYLCSLDPNGREVYDWILKWLAYPLQYRGAKMHSAILIHGPQGTGKSRFFEAYAAIFGEYSRVLGQEALEDKFNADWAEKKLFIVGDEVLARQDMFHIKNRLKGFITGSHIRVNPKNVAAHTEKNQMNIVFLSNERQPLVLENDDRRHCVIWTPGKPDDGFFAEVNDEIDNGGIAALHHYLLGLDLGDFKPWTKPPMTVAKQDLIALGTGSEERFLSAWQRLEVDNKDGDALPFCPCLGSHLYRAYEDWCKREGEFRPRPSNHFLNYLGKQAGWRTGKPESTWTSLSDKTPKSRKMVVPSAAAMAQAVQLVSPASAQADLSRDRFGTQAEWFTACFFAFEKALDHP